MHAVDTTDLEYVRHGDSPLLVRITRPRGPGPFPALVDVHGGGWVSGTRLQNAVIAQYLAARGVVVASLDFRMPPTAAYPHPVADIHLGIRWLKAHAREFGADPDRIGGYGSSSGGHQLLLATLRPNDPRYAALTAPDIPAGLTADLKFLALAWPVSDPLARFDMARDRAVASLIDAHGAYWPNETAMGEGNPHLIVERGEAKSLLPLLVLQGTKDDNLPDGMNGKFVAAWRKAGGAAEIEYFEDQPHTFISRAPDSPAAQRAMAMVAEFVMKHG